MTICVGTEGVVNMIWGGSGYRTVFIMATETWWLALLQEFKVTVLCPVNLLR